MKPLEKLIKVLASPASDRKGCLSLASVDHAEKETVGRVFTEACNTIDEHVKHAERIAWAEIVTLKATQIEVRSWDEHPHNGSSFNEWEATFQLAKYPGLEEALVKILRKAVVHREREKVKVEREKLLDELAEKRANELLERD